MLDFGHVSCTESGFCCGLSPELKLSLESSLGSGSSPMSRHG